MNDAKPNSDRLCPRLALACTKCGATGLIPWDRLDRVLCCHSSATWYRVEHGSLTETAAPEEKLQVAVRGGLSHWHEHQSTAKQRTPPRDWRTVLLAPIEWLRFVGWPVQSALAGALVTLTVAAVFLCSGRAAETTAAVPLPTALTERASLFAQAWVAHDLPTLLRLTNKSNDRQLRRWFSQTPPPQIADASADQPPIEAAVERRQAHYAAVTVRIAAANQSGKGASLVQRQEWVEQDGAWYFLPRLATTSQMHARH